MITRLLEAEIETDVGQFIETLYTDGKEHAITLSYGNPFDSPSLLLRIHSHCLSSHVFLFNGCDCRGQMLRSQQRIQAAGGGLIIWLDQEGRSNGHLAKMAAEKWKKLGHSQGEAYLASGYKEDNRDYSIALKILEHFKPRAIHLLTGNPLKAAAVSSLGVRVTTEEI